MRLRHLLMVTTTIGFGVESQAVTLDEAIASAIENNRMLRVERQKLAEAKGTRTKAYAGFLPSIRISEGWMRTNDPVNAFGTRLRQEAFNQADFDVARLNTPSAITNWQTKLEVRQPLFNGGASIARRRAAGRMVDAAAAQLRNAEQRTVLHTIEAYWRAVLAQSALAAVRSGLTSARGHARSAEAAFTQETIPRTDLLAARVRVAELEADAIAAEDRVAKAREGLSLMMGAPRSRSTVPTDSLRGHPIAGAPDVATALERRADLAAARNRVEAAREGGRIARGSWIPRLNAFFDGHLDSDVLGERAGESWTAGAILSWDLFAGGKTIGEVREARARVKQAEEAMRFAEAAAEREIVQTYRALTSAARRVEIGSAAAEQAEERLRIADLQFREGLVTTTDVLDAEAGLTRARLRLSQALHDLNVGAARMRYVTGERIKVE